MYQITYFSAAQGRLIQAGAVEGQNLIERLADLQKEDIRPTEITVDGNECALINRILTEINPALMVYDAFIHDHGFVVLRGYFVGLLSNLAAHHGRRLGALRRLDRSKIAAISPTWALCGWCKENSEVIYTHSHTYLCELCADLAEQLQNGAASIGRARDFQDGGQLQAGLDSVLSVAPLKDAKMSERAFATCSYCKHKKEGIFFVTPQNYVFCTQCFDRARVLQLPEEKTRQKEFMDDLALTLTTEFNAGHVLETFETDVQFQKLQSEAVPGRQWINPNKYPFYVPMNGQAVEWVTLDGSAAAGKFDSKFTNHFIKFAAEEEPGSVVTKEEILKWRAL